MDFDYLLNDFNDVSTFHDESQDLCFDFPEWKPTTSSLTHPKISNARPIDYPSQQKHYGIVNFFEQKLPIIYRLLNDTQYIPYIRFSYVLNIFEHSSYKSYLVNIRNLPVLEMTTVERTYYEQLSPIDNSKPTIDWSDLQLLCVSMLDGTLEIIHFLRDFQMKTDLSSSQWEELLNQIRNQCKTRWILEEQLVLNRLKQIDSTCLSKNTIAQRRTFFEQRVICFSKKQKKDLHSLFQLDLSIVNEAGGFVQIESYIYPYIKNSLDNQIYINLNDIQQNFTLPLTDMITYVDQTSTMYRSYTTVMQQAQVNFELNRKQTNELRKYLPQYRQDIGEIPFLSLQMLLHLFLRKNSNLNLQFVQLFENCSLNEIELNYKSNVARQFIMSDQQRQGGLINNQIPCLILMKNNCQQILIATETKTRRLMSNDERFYFNVILIYNGLAKKCLIRKKQWYLKPVDGNEKESIRIELLK